MADLSEYEITFRRNPLIGLWSWTAITPDGRTLTSFGISASKGSAEADALQRIEKDRATETIRGDELAARVARSGAEVGPDATEDEA